LYETFSLPFRVASISNNRGISISLWLSGVRVGLSLVLANGRYNLTTSDTTVYQRILIPMAAFGLSADATFDTIRLTPYGGNTSWAVDYVRLVANGLRWTISADGAVMASAFTQDGGILVGKGPGAYQEETGATARASLGLGTAAVADTGTGAPNVILGNDSRLTDERVPTAAGLAAKIHAACSRTFDNASPNGSCGLPAVWPNGKSV
jgi:hypothetical protein